MQKSTGINNSEKYLTYLGTRSFLSLWSYANVFYEPGKELCDLLVICGNNIIIFQDKQSEFPKIDDIEVAWKRWFNRTIRSGAKQVWGAERSIKGPNPTLFVDPACTIPIPISIPDPTKAVFSLILVTHGGSAKCKELLGGSGSFMLRSNIKSLDEHVDPFVIGDLDSKRTFVHVLDDTTLDILMRTLDTITDFTMYLEKKEKLFRSKMAILAAGDEELLANYLKNMNGNNEHDFDFGIGAKEVDMLALDEGGWSSFIENPQRLAQVEQDKVSYMWDDLIETFNRHAQAGTQYLIPDLHFVKGVELTEKVVRFMAREPRFVRRMLSSSIKEMLMTTAENQRRIRIMSSLREEPTYVVLLFPLPKSENISYEDYRKTRAIFLEGTCMVAKMMNPKLNHIIGIATESGLKNDGRSEDALYLDATEWTDEMQNSAKKFQDEFVFLFNRCHVAVSAMEYPEVVSREEFLKNPRNKPCPCGSGNKYKKCCYQKGIKYYR